MRCSCLPAEVNSALDSSTCKIAKDGMRDAEPPRGQYARKEWWVMISQRAFIAALICGSGALLSPSSSAHAQQLPTPKALISGLDLECYRTPGPSMDFELMLTHLNPVLRELGLPQHEVRIKELVQTCVPVRKNNV